MYQVGKNRGNLAMAGQLQHSVTLHLVNSAGMKMQHPCFSKHVTVFLLNSQQLDQNKKIMVNQLNYGERRCPTWSKGPTTETCKYNLRYVK